jgi:hypothetical protein
MSTDSTLDFLLADAKRLGLTPAEYEREFHVILHDGDRPSPAAQRIRRHEVLSGLMTEEDIGIAYANEKRRANARRRRAILPPNDCD